MIQGVGKGGNPHTMQVTPGMVVGVGTDVICGEGLIVTCGAVDIGACLSQSRNSFMSALSSGVTTIFGVYFIQGLKTLWKKSLIWMILTKKKVAEPDQLRAVSQTQPQVPIT